jgi:hypothetical protein
VEPRTHLSLGTAPNKMEETRYAVSFCVMCQPGVVGR